MTYASAGAKGTTISEINLRQQAEALPAKRYLHRIKMRLTNKGGL
ncbi:MAG: hypothetical protein WC780_09665 [Lentimicrobiaceae bacterium]